MNLNSLINYADLTSVIKDVFIKVVINLISDYNNQKYRQINANSKLLNKYVALLGERIVTELFNLCGFEFDEKVGKWVFTADRAKLEEALQLLTTYIQNDKDINTAEKQHVTIAEKAETINTFSGKSLEATHNKRSVTCRNERDCCHMLVEDSMSVELELKKCYYVDDQLCEQVKRMLLNFDHIRNSLFDAKKFMVRRMTNGRSYLCRERCDHNNLEAHWHLHSGKGLLYSFVAHVNKDGTQLLHTGAEHGYQYNSIPGSLHFGKIIHFSEKLIDKNGKLLYVKNDNNAV